MIGTSTCDCAVVSADKQVADIPGICGIVKGAILPGYYGIEAGQSAVGDIFKWWVEGVCGGDAALHAELTAEAAQAEARARPASWRSTGTTATGRFSSTSCSPGLILGQDLYTTRAEIYRALIEATAFGARAIIERLARIRRADRPRRLRGGIAEKNPLLMQIYADVTGCAMQVAGSSQSLRARLGDRRRGAGRRAPRLRQRAGGDDVARSRSVSSRSRRAGGLRPALRALPRVCTTASAA